jgi:X-X-X-Leu-X-X-Gly heptad repeat protein
MSIYSQLFLRSINSPYGDFTRNSVLSFKDLDQNFIFLKERDINSINYSSNTLTIETLGGNSFSTTISSGGGGGSGVWTSGSTGLYSIKANNISTIDATANYSVASGFNTLASGISSYAEGANTTASGDNSHAEGLSTIASGDNSHAEGLSTTSSGDNSHAEGESTIASGDNSHAGGNNSVGSGVTSFIHSTNSLVSGDRSVVLGGQNITGTTDDTVYVPNLEIRGQAYTPIYDNLTGGTTFIPDWDNSNTQILTLSGNTNVSGGTSTMEGGSAYTMLVKQSNSGSHTITWDSTYKWEAGSPPTLSVADGSVDIITFICDGTYLYGLIAKDFQ